MNLSIKQFAKKAGVSEPVIRKRISKGEIKTIPVQIKNKWVSFIDIEEYPIAEHRARKAGAPKKSR